MSSMDELTIEEIRRLNVLGYIAITGNGHVTAVVEEDRADKAELERCVNGY